jgi:hypothetical protein
MNRSRNLYFLATTLLGAGLVGLIASPASAQRNPERDAFFGETHVHTSWSFDAYIFGNHFTGPAERTDTPKAKPSSIRSVTTSRSTRRLIGWG